MTRFVKKIRRFFHSEDGPTAIEYAVMLALIVTVCLSAVTTIGKDVKKSFKKVTSSLKSGS